MCYGVADWFYLKKQLNSIVLSGANNGPPDGIMLSCPVKTNLPRPTSCMTETMFHASWILNVQCCLQAFNILHLEELSRQLPCCPRKSLFAGVLVHLENSNSKNAINMGDFYRLNALDLRHSCQIMKVLVRHVFVGYFTEAWKSKTHQNNALVILLMVLKSDEHQGFKIGSCQNTATVNSKG